MWRWSVNSLVSVRFPFERLSDDEPRSSDAEIKFAGRGLDASCRVCFEKILYCVNVFWSANKRRSNQILTDDAACPLEAFDETFKSYPPGNFMLVGDLEVSDVFTSERLYWL